MAGPLRRFGRRSAAVLAGAWFVSLALLVAGPLLGRGHLILLDFPAGPALPKLSLLPLPSSGEVGNAIPLNAAHVLLQELWEPLPEKLFLLLPIVVGGLGLYRLVRSALGVGAVAGLYGGTLYVVNPFLYDRYLSGHVHFVLGYALLPWALLPLVRTIQARSRGSAAVMGLWIGALACISFQVAGLYALLVALIAIVSFGRARARAAFAAAAAGLGALISAYWLLPLFFAPERRVGTADLDAYESRPDGFEIVPTLLALYGFWREEFVRPVEERPALYLLLVPILALVVVGGAVLLRSTKDRRMGVALIAAGTLGVLLAAGTAFPPTSELFRWLFTRVPFAGAYREPQKFLALTVLAYAVFGAAGLERLSRGGRRFAAVAPIAVASVLLYGHAMLWGLSGEVQLSRYPDSWAEADRLMKSRGDGRLLVLPWWLYEHWTFTDGRIVANPAISFFSGREVLSADDAGFEDVPPASVDPFSYYIDDLLERDEPRRFGREVAPLGVRFVAWTVEADPEDYQLLSGQADLTQIYFSGDLAVFENRAWRGEVMGLSAIREPEPYVESVWDARVSLVRRLPGWKTVAPPQEPAVSVGERCNDGWRLGGARARCHLGAVAAFETPETAAVLWRPFVAIQLLAYAISVAALALALLRLLRPKRRGPGSTRPSKALSASAETTD